MLSEEAGGEPHGKAIPSFQESAKKFRPGPVAPPEPEAPDMSGAEGPEAAPPAQQFVAGATPAGMSEGAPGHLQNMPGE
jgi:hypothetical protein